MEDIVERTESRYIIVRVKGNEKEYFDSATIYGRDSDGVLIVTKTKWSKEFHSAHTNRDFDRTKNILNGMRKYGEIENEYEYVIAEIQTVVSIVDYIID